jgi:hypothetical protein
MLQLAGRGWRRSTVHRDVVHLEMNLSRWMRALKKNSAKMLLLLV